MRSTPSDPQAASGTVVLAFGEHELHLDSGELFRAGAPVKLQPQPAKVLEILIRRTGEVVSREEIQAHVWGESTFLDADANLNFCIKQIRRALDDPASSPRYIETIPRRGYRFLVAVEARPLTPPAAGTAAPAAPPRSWHLRFAGLAAVGLSLVILALLVAMRQLSSPETPRGAAPQVPSEAREHYLRALYIRRKDPGKAVEELRQATLLAPDFAEAHALLAWEEADLGQSPAVLLPGTELTARRAVELDPHLSRAHLALGRVLFHYKLDWKQGEAEIRRAIELDPGQSDAWHALALPLAARGKYKEAIASAEKARELDPEGMLVNADLAWFYYLGRQYDEAVRQARSAIALRAPGKLDASRHGEIPFFRWAWRVILYSSLQTGDRRAGLEAARALMEAYGDPAAAKELVRVEDYWSWERERFLTFVRQRGGQTDDALGSDALAENAAAAGQPDRALPYLETACRAKWPGLLLVAAADPLFDPLHGNPRFERFLDCIGVPADAPSRRR